VRLQLIQGAGLDELHLDILERVDLSRRGFAFQMHAIGRGKQGDPLGGLGGAMQPIGGRRADIDPSFQHPCGIANRNGRLVRIRQAPFAKSDALFVRQAVPQHPEPKVPAALRRVARHPQIELLIAATVDVRERHPQTVNGGRECHYGTVYK
jgi:hypothetical protein